MKVPNGNIAFGGRITLTFEVTSNESPVRKKRKHSLIELFPFLY